MNKRGNKKRGQVWVETVIYLLIAFVMIGLVLSFVRPKIEELRDKTIVEQSIELMKDLDNIILTIGSPGNKRAVEMGIKKGRLTINGESDIIIFEIDSKYIYSEPGVEIPVGNINATTEKRARDNLIILKRDYSAKYNLTYNGQETSKALSAASTPYKLFVSNSGETNKTNINFELG